MPGSFNACAVLCCPSTDGPGTSSDVWFFDFPHPNDPRYSTWIERTQRGNQWSPTPSSKICSKHFNPADILTGLSAPGTIHRMLQYDALPCVFQCLPESVRPRLKPVPRPDSPEIGVPDCKRPRWEVTNCDESAQTRKSDAGISTPSVDTEDIICCVPGCSNRRKHCPRGTVQFHPFPEVDPLRTKWAKRVRRAITWHPDSRSFVCSAHFVSEDYDTVSGTLVLKSVAVPSSFPFHNFLACVTPFLKLKMNDGMSSRRCAICGSCRLIKQKHYKPAEKLAFFPFPKNINQRDKWLRVCGVASVLEELFACENHFLIKDIMRRYAESDEEWIEVREGVLPDRSWTLNFGHQPSQIGTELLATSSSEKETAKALAADEAIVKLETNVAASDVALSSGAKNVSAVTTREDCKSSIVLVKEVVVTGKSDWGLASSDPMKDSKNSITVPAVVAKRVIIELQNSENAPVVVDKGSNIRFRNSKDVGVNGATETAKEVPCRVEECCVPGCIVSSQNAPMRAAILFPFVSARDRRYAAWFNRIRCVASWIPEKSLKICSEHFAASDLMDVPQTGGMLWQRQLTSSAIPERLACISAFHFSGVRDDEGDTLISVATVLQTCVVCQARRKAGSLKQSEKLRFFPFPVRTELRYSWLKFLTDNGKDQIITARSLVCENHFLPDYDFDQRTRELIPTAVPSRIFCLTAEDSVITKDKLKSFLKQKEQHSTADKKDISHSEIPSGRISLQWDCCVPGCKNVKGTWVPQNFMLLKFISSDDPRYETWVRRIQYNSAWNPGCNTKMKICTKICMDHFSPSDFSICNNGPGETPRGVLSSTAMPSRLSCLVSLCYFNRADEGTGRKGCVACGLRKVDVLRQLKPSELLKLIAAPRDAALREKWIDFCCSQNPALDRAVLSGKSSWYVCENHFASEILGYHSRGNRISAESQPRLLDAVPSVPFFLDVYYTDPKLVLAFGKSSVPKIVTERKGSVFPTTYYACCVPGCRATTKCAKGSEKLTFHIFPCRTSERFHEWANGIRCAVSWNPNNYDYVCSRHFLPEDYVEETAKGKQPKQRLLKKTAVPSQLQCVNQFRTPTSLDVTVTEGVRNCSVCGCWREVVKSVGRRVRSERLSFFPLPTNDLRDIWISACRKLNPNFVVSNDSVVCENHFRTDDLVWMLEEQKKVTKLMLKGPAVPLERNLPWLGLPGAQNVEESTAVENSELLPLSEDFFDFDTLDDEAGMDADISFSASEPPAFISAVLVAEDSVLADGNDAGDGAVTDVPDLPSALPFSVDEELPVSRSLTSPPPGLVQNDALIYCAVCQTFLDTPCWMHAAKIPDSVVPLAVSSLPSVLYLDDVKDSPTAKTVFTKELLPRHTVFGPLIAPLAENLDHSARYFSVSGGRRKQYDLQSDDLCNWMKYVVFVDNMDDSNLLVFARGEEIVFVTAWTVSPNEQLKVSYSKQYSETVLKLKSDGPDLDAGTLRMVVATNQREILTDKPAFSGESARENGGERTSSSDNLRIPLLPVETGLPCTLTGASDHTGIICRKNDNQTQDRKKPIPRIRYCSVCNIQFRTFNLLEIHKLRHGPERYASQMERKCPECSTRCESFYDLQQHVETHGRKVVLCPVCGERCSTYSINLHIQYMHPNYKDRQLLAEPYYGSKNLYPEGNHEQTGRDYLPGLTCDECGLRFPTYVLCQIHKYRHGKSVYGEDTKPPKECPKCNKVFKSTNGLAVHVERHGKRLRKCPVCGTLLSQLAYHLENHHPDYRLSAEVQGECSDENRSENVSQNSGDGELNKNHKCQKCTKIFRSMIGLQAHVKARHSMSVCIICTDTFDTSAELNVHVNIHKTTKGFECGICGQAFPFYRFLAIHVAQHATQAEIPVTRTATAESNECIVCRECFSSATEFKIHIKTHENNDGFPCRECNEKFPFYRLLSRHLSTHHQTADETMDFHCGRCGERFSQGDSLELHMLACHDTELLRFQCDQPQCGKRFRSMEHLQTHASFVHADPKSTGIWQIVSRQPKELFVVQKGLELG